jgi:hypothetical protein
MWIITARQHISTEVTVKGYKKSCISTAVDETDDDMLWNGIEEGGMTVKRKRMLGVSVSEMKALTVKTETVALIGNNR